MEYAELLAGIAYTGAVPSGQATHVTQDSRRIRPGGVFVCIRGQGADGHEFVKKAIDAGAGMVVCGRPLGLDREVVVKDTRAAYAAMCQNFFGRPAEKLRLIAVTGTNGKTTVAYVIRQLLENLGVSCGFIGTTGIEYGNVSIPAKFTTPEAWDLAALLARMVDFGCTHVVMEASSQALAQGRLAKLRFALGIFTNLSKDHWDYHGGEEAYFEAKRSLFLQCDAMLANLDDAYGLRLLEDAALGAPKMLPGGRRSFSVVSDAADFTARSIDLRAGGVRFAFLGAGFLHRISFPIPGQYSVANALAAASAAVMLGYLPDKSAEALSAVRGVRGRCEVLHNEKFTVIRDFAHTGEGMDMLLSSLKPFVSGRMLVLFGCAGEREATKRLEMGAAAARWGDVVYLACDNPRREDIAKTMNDAMPPIKESKKKLVAEPDRAKATVMALNALREGDMLVLCSKGHEDYQVMDGYTLYYDEERLVKDWLCGRAAQHETDGEVL